MSVQTDFVVLVTAIFAARVYPGVAPASAAKPYATYFRVASVEGSTLDTNGGTGNESNTRLQVDIWTETYLDAQSKAAAVKSALKGWSVENVVLAEQDLFDTETRLHRVLLDVSTWHR